MCDFSECSPRKPCAVASRTSGGDRPMPSSGADQAQGLPRAPPRLIRRFGATCVATAKGRDQPVAASASGFSLHVHVGPSAHAIHRREEQLLESDVVVDVFQMTAVRTPVAPGEVTLDAVRAGRSMVCASHSASAGRKPVMPPQRVTETCRHRQSAAPSSNCWSDSQDGGRAHAHTGGAHHRGVTGHLVGAHGVS